MTKRLLNKHTKMGMKNHEMLGEYLGELQAEFECLGSLLRTNGYGLASAIKRVKSALSRLQNELEERLAQDHPAEWTTGVYHGDVDKRDAVRYMASITGLRED